MKLDNFFTLRYSLENLPTKSTLHGYTFCSGISLNWCNAWVIKKNWENVLIYWLKLIEWVKKNKFSVQCSWALIIRTNLLWNEIGIYIRVDKTVHKNWRKSVTSGEIWNVLGCVKFSLSLIGALQLRENSPQKAVIGNNLVSKWGEGLSGCILAILKYLCVVSYHQKIGSKWHRPVFAISFQTIDSSKKYIILGVSWKTDLENERP